jgi:hypothetical protein
MAFCRTAEFLYEAVPLRPLRDWLIRTHMEKCPACQARLLSLEEARGLLVAPDQAGDPQALWRRIASAAAGRPAGLRDKRPVPSGAALKWAAVTVMAAVLALSGFWLLRESGRSGLDMSAAGPAARFEIAYVKVGGTPAQTFVYQPQGSDTVFVWAQKTP